MCWPDHYQIILFKKKPCSGNRYLSAIILLKAEKYLRNVTPLYDRLVWFSLRVDNEEVLCLCILAITHNGI